MSGLAQPINVEQQRDALIAEYKKSSGAVDVTVNTISLDGRPALRLEHPLVDETSGQANAVITVQLPVESVRYDIILNYSPGQDAAAKVAMGTVLAGFKPTPPQVASAPVAQESGGTWRIVVFTLVCFVLGAAASLLLGVLSGAGEKPEDTPARQGTRPGKGPEKGNGDSQ